MSIPTHSESRADCQSALPNHGSDSILTALVEEIAARLQAGKPVDVEACLREHPEHAERLRALLPTVRVLAELGRSAAAGEASVPPTEADLVEPDHKVLGDFRIVREIGRGGMGVVYEAEQVSLGRTVALKVLPFAATLDPRQLQRFKNEAQAAAHLQHTNIVPVHFVGCERGVHYYAMQYIEGQSLAQVICDLRFAIADCHQSIENRKSKIENTAVALSTERPTADLRTVARLGIQAAEALDHAHEMGIVHRDIKPGNLLVDARGNLWITDFGLAQFQRDVRLTLTGDVVGTLRYMSPEQALAKRVVIDHRSDIYSLGATLYELLTLEPVFAGRDREELLRQIAFEEPQRPRRLNRAIPAELETIVLKALEKAPQDRYATAQELADDLRCFLEDRPIRAKRPSPVQRVRKWVRRHRGAVGTAAVGLLAALAVLAASIGWMARDEAGRQDEREQRAREGLRETAALLEKQRGAEARAAVDRAEELLGGDGDEDLQQQARQLRADMDMVLRVENIRLELGAFVDWRVYFGEVDAAYGPAFREYGLDVERLDPHEAGARIRARPIGLDLAAALDHWASVRRNLERAGWKHLLAVARIADPDRWRIRLRDALERKDLRALKELGASKEVDELPPTTLALLGEELAALGGEDSSMAVLLTAQHRHPGDFWINHFLALRLKHMRPARRVEASRFMTVAVALRPDCPGAHVNLGNELNAIGAHDEAIAEFREALRLKKDYAQAHNNLGAALHGKGRLDEAIAEYQEALRINNNYAPAHNNIGRALYLKGRLNEAITKFREALRLDKDYAAAHHFLGAALMAKGRLDEAIPELQKATRLKNDYPEALNDLGIALMEKNRLDEAIAAYRMAFRLKRNYAEAHNNLGEALTKKGRLDEAIVEYRECLRINPNIAEAHANIGVTLMQKGQTDEAIAELKQAIHLNRGFAGAHYYLGIALRKKGQPSQAIAAFEEAIRLKKDYADAHFNLGLALDQQGRLDEAIVEYKASLQFQKDFPEAYYNLGNALKMKGSLDEAIAAYQAAIRLNQNYAVAHCNLGQALRKKGHLRQALEAFRIGHNLGSQNKRWPYPSAEWVKECEQLVRLDDRLAGILKGMDRPVSAAERAQFARLCMVKRHFAAATRLFQEAFVDQPKLADDLKTAVRYDAACAAALAGSGKGEDAAKLEEKERARLRKQALDWLRADLTAWRHLLVKFPDKARPEVSQKMQHWRQDVDFAGVRGEAALAKLPDAERKDWRQLWADVEKTLLKTREKTASKEKASK